MTEPRSTEPGNTASATTVDAERVYSARRRVVIIAGVLPIAVALATTLLALSWLPSLPDPVAIHWGPGGVDGYGSAILTVVMLPLLTVAYTVFAVAFAWRVTDEGNLYANQKVLAVSSPWFAVLLSVILGGSLWVQRGLSDASLAPDIGPLLLLGFGLSTAVAVTAWFVLPRATRVPLSPESRAEPLPLAGAERAVWSRTITISPAGWWVVGIGVVLALGAVVGAVLADAMWPVAAILFAVLLLPLATIVSWRVTVDRRGLRARSALGWPTVFIPAEEIRSVRAITVNPLREFGGWGYRWDTADRVGVVVRTGPAIEVERTKGKRFVVTVPDADTAARLLAAHIR